MNAMTMIATQNAVRTTNHESIEKSVELKPQVRRHNAIDVQNVSPTCNRIIAQNIFKRAALNAGSANR